MKEYVEEVLWRCLLHEAYRDAEREREADGEAMLSHWRIYMPELFNRNHPNYVWVAHRFLARKFFTIPCVPEKKETHFLRTIFSQTYN